MLLLVEEELLVMGVVPKMISAALSLVGVALNTAVQGRASSEVPWLTCVALTAACHRPAALANPL